LEKNDITEKYFSIFLLIFLLECGSKVDIENVIKLHLNDPDSVKFKQVLASKDATRACTE